MRTTVFDLNERTIDDSILRIIIKEFFKRVSGDARVNAAPTKCCARDPEYSKSLKDEVQRRLLQKNRALFGLDPALSPLIYRHVDIDTPCDPRLGGKEGQP